MSSNMDIDADAGDIDCNIDAWDNAEIVDASTMFDIYADKVIQELRAEKQKRSKENHDREVEEQIRILKAEISELATYGIDEQNMTRLSAMTFELNALETLSNDKPIKINKLTNEEFEKACSVDYSFLDLDEPPECFICTEKCNTDNPLIKMNCCKKSLSCQKCARRALNERKSCPFCRFKIAN